MRKDKKDKRERTKSCRKRKDGGALSTPTHETQALSDHNNNNNNEDKDNEDKDKDEKEGRRKKGRRSTRRSLRRRAMCTGGG